MLDPQSYPPVIRELLAERRLAPLGPGKPNESARAGLAGMKAASLLCPEHIADPNMAEACLAGLYLYHDCLDESHNISQELNTTEGSYWHALMHRREPDFGNSKYWFRRVGRHPIIAELSSHQPEAQARDPSLARFGLAS